MLTRNRSYGSSFVKQDYLGAHITKIEDGKETVFDISFGNTKADVDKPDEWMNAVIIKGFGQHPITLLTNKEPGNQTKKEVHKVVEIYLTRWECDECYRYIRQACNLEDVRVRSYNAIRNITAIVNTIAYFTSVYRSMNLKLKLMVQKVFILSKRFFGIPTFYNYAMADDIFELLKKSNTGIFTNKNDNTVESIVLSLFPE
jgi:hypothetical protein